mmetsp:Transcript_4037/g.7755  ORF Transcript_4037/g.7755 Transcript_4037/m.7755 type:complete len:335 (+) Transcript_4037:129-1133(+)
MSLSALNYPPLVALSGIGLGASLPTVEQIAAQTPWNTLRLVNLLSYGINFISVQRPGRLDSQAAEGGELAPRTGKTLVAPSGWAFAIWGPIFLGELVGVTAPFFLSETDPIVELLKKVSGPFISAQLFQSLWCAAFRPKYNKKGEGYMFVSTGMLAATAYSLSRAHAVFTANPHVYSKFQYGIFFCPMALHFGWTTAATLVNLNGSVAMKEGATSTLIKYVGHASVVAASIIGVYVAKVRDAPVFAGVIAWALSAVADGMKRRLNDKAATEEGSDNKTKKSKENDAAASVGLDGAATQYILSRIGAIVNGLAAAFVAGRLSVGSGSGVKLEMTP